MTAFAPVAEFTSLGADSHHSRSAAELALSAAATFVAGAASVAGRAGDGCVHGRGEAGETDQKK